MFNNEPEAKMGFLEYAWANSLQKDELKTKIRIDPQIDQPMLLLDQAGFCINLSTPKVHENGITSFLGCRFPTDLKGKIWVGKLFRASVLHLSAHTKMPMHYCKYTTEPTKHDRAAIFAQTLVSDSYVNSYISSKCPEGLADIAFADAIAFSRLKPSEGICNQATRIMGALLSKANIGIVKGCLSPGEEKTVIDLANRLISLEQKFKTALDTENTRICKCIEQTVKDVENALETNGPVLEVPSFPHTEKTGPCSLFFAPENPLELDIELAFKKTLETLGSGAPSERSIELSWNKASDAEASQAFDSWFHQRAREERMIGSIREYAEFTKFKSISFPEEDYTQYIRARAFVSGGSRRLLDSLRVAQDALDEDPGKEMGQLDLSAVIQVLASRKPATDVFMLDEYLSRSFAWAILFDVSASMKVRGEFARAMAICIAEATKELLMDPGSWTFSAFSDHFYILKYAGEPYSRRVRARIGGLKFGGLTYTPDALQVAGRMLMKRYDEQRFLIVISDGYPNGYPDIQGELAATVDSLRKKGVIVIGVGVETDEMKKFFELNSSVYDQKDLIKKFSKIFLGASATALET